MWPQWCTKIFENTKKYTVMTVYGTQRYGIYSVLYRLVCLHWHTKNNIYKQYICATGAPEKFKSLIKFGFCLDLGIGVAPKKRQNILKTHASHCY